MSRIKQATLAVAAASALAATAPPLAPAQAATTTITAIGDAQVKPEPRDRHNDASIRRAVEVASAKGLPLAIADGREHAAALAKAGGFTLGALLSLSDNPANGVPYFYLPQNGTFGTGRFCGKVRNTRTVVRANGVRRRVVTKGSHTVCRVPSTIVSTVSLTFATV